MNRHPALLADPFYGKRTIWVAQSPDVCTGIEPGRCGHNMLLPTCRRVRLLSLPNETIWDSDLIHGHDLLDLDPDRLLIFNGT